MCFRRFLFLFAHALLISLGECLLAKRMISALEIFCSHGRFPGPGSHRKTFCEWRGEVAELQSHLMNDCKVLCAFFSLSDPLCAYSSFLNSSSRLTVLIAVSIPIRTQFE